MYKRLAEENAADKQRLDWLESRRGEMTRGALLYYHSSDESEEHMLDTHAGQSLREAIDCRRKSA